MDELNVIDYGDVVIGLFVVFLLEVIDVKILLFLFYGL